ncbi:hypothetical protein F1188_08710 [Roseospira marina]|uniref:Calcium-binding protein n=1 Tax=Roseospira marina TaxID=140057 RepID=A0A5M6IEU4_9PROT|nr:hypothetical protein [Roseospira marina]KAA5606078.1 hypothetical protein F1188_08710 [Roseospira marina]MBB4313056.1 hypothetical protein [Roseospira marina]MBB5086203.1 hypothetical protein [Roseospira marina]
MSMTFNAEYYLANNQDVRDAIVLGTFGAGLTTDYNGDGEVTNADLAEYHYNTFGWLEDRDPNATFDTSAYLDANPDVLLAGVNPFTHFLTLGLSEGRSPNASIPRVEDFDAETYLANNEDVQTAVDNGDFDSAYQHYVLYGQYEGRAAQTTGGQTITPQQNNATGETFTLTTAVGEEIVGTAGNDTFNVIIGTGATLNNFDTIDGLNGTDKANILADADVTAAQLGQFSNVETVVINQADADGQAAIDISGTSVRNFTVEGNGMTAAAAVTVAEGTTVTANTTAAGALAVTGAKDVSALTAVADGTNVNAFTFAETNASVETVNASGEAAATVTVTATATTETANISLSEDTALTVVGGSLETLNMGGSTGDMTVTLLANITSVTGGSGADAITDVAGLTELTADLGAGNDTFVIANGDNTKAVSLTLGAGDDTVDVNALANADIDALADTMISIKDFNAAEDVLDLAGLAAGDGYIQLTNTQLSNIAGEATLEDAAAAAVALTATGANDGFTAFDYGGNMYVVKNDGTAAFADTDGILEVVGVNVDDMDASNFVTA